MTRTGLLATKGGIVNAARALKWLAPRLANQSVPGEVVDACYTLSSLLTYRALPVIEYRLGRVA